MQPFGSYPLKKVIMHTDRIGHSLRCRDGHMNWSLLGRQSRIYYFTNPQLLLTVIRCQKGNVFISSLRLVKVKICARKKVFDIINRPLGNDLGENYGATSWPVLCLCQAEKSRSFIMNLQRQKYRMSNARGFPFLRKTLNQGAFKV